MAAARTKRSRALLHDAAEDQGGRARLEDIRARFGDAVARIVEDCTDSWTEPKEPWLERKQAYIQHARTLSGPSLRVSAADKVHNSYAILRDLRNSGERVWERFQATPDDVLAYYESLVRAYREAGGGAARRRARPHRPRHPARNGVLRYNVRSLLRETTEESNAHASSIS